MEIIPCLGKYLLNLAYICVTVLHDPTYAILFSLNWPATCSMWPVVTFVIPKVSKYPFDCA